MIGEQVGMAIRIVTTQSRVDSLGGGGGGGAGVASPPPIILPTTKYQSLEKTMS